MAIAKICDRCRNIYAKNEHQEDFGENKYGTVKGIVVMFDETDRGFESTPSDKRKNAYMGLCPTCAAMLCRFLKDASLTANVGKDDDWRWNND